MATNDTNPAWVIPPSPHSPTPSLARKDLPIPTPGSHQVLIRIASVSLNFRDLLVSTHSPAYPVQASPNLVPCTDAAATIISTGPNSIWTPGTTVLPHPVAWLSGDVQNLRLDTVFGGGDVHGTLQRYMVLDDERVVRAPKNLSLEEAGALVCAGTTVVNALLYGPKEVGEGGLRGEWVLTQGMGGVSVFGIQIAAALGATVIATSSSDEKLEVAKKLGAKYVINYKTTPDWDEEVLRITDRRGVDHVLEVGGAQTIEKSLKSTRVGGLVTVIGILSESATADLVPAILYGAKIVRGSLSQSKEMLEKLVEVVEEYDIHPVISKTFEFAQAVEAFEMLKGQAFLGKIVIKGP